MQPALYIALRFTAARKRALSLSLSGVILGVAFFISTQAQTKGFEEFFISTVLGSSGAVVIGDRFQSRYSTLIDTAKKADGESAASAESDAVTGMVSGQQPRKYYPGISNPPQLMAAVQDYSGVIALAPLVEGTVTARADFKDEIFKLDGIDLDAHLRTTALRSQVIAGSVDRFRDKPYGLLLGSLLADKLGLYDMASNQAQLGAILYLTGPGSDTHPFTLEGVFQTGINVIDQGRAYGHKQAAQSILRMPDTISSIIVKIRDPERAPQLAASFEEHLSHQSRSWQDREQGNLAIFRTIRLSAGITVSLIILLAGFGIFNILTMTVLNKVREIAILRSMGYQRSDIRNIFIYQGLIVATLGSVVGCILGALLTLGISHIPIHIRGIIHADTFVVSWSWHHYVSAAVIAFVSVLVASYFPARRAALLPPVDTLRGSGQ